MRIHKINALLIAALLSACASSPNVDGSLRYVIPANGRIHRALDTATANTVSPAIFVANCCGLQASVTAYLESDDGDVTPQIFIRGPQTGFEGVEGVSLDATGRLYVSGQTVPVDSAAVFVFKPGANGFASPNAVISCTATNTNYPGISVSSDGKIFVTALPSPSVTIFPPQTSGCVQSPRSISGPHTGLADPIGIAVGRLGRILVVNASVPSITEYTRGSSGDAEPVRTIAGSATKLIEPVSVALDRRGRMYVTDAGGQAINIYGPNAEGNAPPIARIRGSHTAIYDPFGIAVSSSGTIFESDQFENSLHVYAPNANGDVAPIQTIAGPNTGLHGPSGIALYEPANK